MVQKIEKYIAFFHFVSLLERHVLLMQRALQYYFRTEIDMILCFIKMKKEKGGVGLFGRVNIFFKVCLFASSLQNHIMYMDIIGVET
jgi:hypothetical protein